MKKTNILRSIKLIALILPVIAFVLFTQKNVFCFIDHSTERVRRFYQEEENSLDVVFLGASDVFSGFSSALAYEEYGFTSYMYAIDANPGPLHKYQLKEVLSRQDPQLLIVEINGFLNKDTQYDVDEARLRTFVENIPMSLNKLEVISRFREEDKLSCLLPFVKYHGDWIQGANLRTRCQWMISTANTPSVLRGIATGTIIDSEIPEISNTPVSNTEEIIVAEDVLLDFISFCREQELENVVFVRFPHKNADSKAVNIAQIQDIVLQQGYSFLNLEDHKDAMGIDPQRDYYNVEHLNIYGQKKLTTYLGNMIATQYDLLPIAQSEENRLHWEECTRYYHDFYAYSDAMISNNIEAWPSETPGAFHQFLDWVSNSESA